MQTMSPERQRAFEAARRKLEAQSDDQGWHLMYLLLPPPPERTERARLLLIGMGEARATAGGAAVAELARRGHAIPSFGPKKGEAVPLDRPGLIMCGALLPHAVSSGLLWKQIEAAALAARPDELPEHFLCSAHDRMRILAKLQQEGEF
jgi:hypothetical protein